MLPHNFVMALLGKHCYPKTFSMINNKRWIGCKEKNALVKLKPDPTLDQSMIMPAFCRPDCINQFKETETP